MGQGPGLGLGWGWGVRAGARARIGVGLGLGGSDWNQGKEGRRACCGGRGANGHHTEDCGQLKGELERLLRGGHLKEYVRRARAA